MKSLRRGSRVAGRRVRRHRRRRGLAARRAHPRVLPGHLDQPLRPPQAQAAAQPRRDRQDRAPGQRRRASPSSRSRSTSSTAGPRSRSRSPRARSPGTSGTPWPSARPTARSSRPSGVGSRAWVTERTRSPGTSDVAPVRAFWEELGLPGLIDVARALPAAQHPARGLRAVRRGRPEDRPRVADPLPASATTTRVDLLRDDGGPPLLDAAVRAQARASRPTSTPGRGSSPPASPR